MYTVKNLWVPESQGISSLDVQVLVTQEGLYCMESVVLQLYTDM
jgi:hypothetical protein